MFAFRRGLTPTLPWVQVPTDRPVTGRERRLPRHLDRGGDVHQRRRPGRRGDSYLIVFRNANEDTRIYTRNLEAGLPAGKTTAANPTFTAHKL